MVVSPQGLSLCFPDSDSGEQSWHSRPEGRPTTVGRRWADVCETSNAAGESFILVAWEELRYATDTQLMSTLYEEETLRVASSIH